MISMILLVAQIVIAALLIGMIILQLPPEDNWQTINFSVSNSKRGVEKLFFLTTIFLLALFVIISLVQLIK